MRAFISYNSSDQDTARLLASLISANGMDVWFAEWNLSIGDSLIGKISEGLDHCSHFVIVWSSDANTSGWVSTEMKSALNRAIATGNPKIVPVLLDDTPLPPLLRDFVHVRLEDGRERSQTLWNAARAVAGQGPADDWLKDFMRVYNEILKVYEAEVHGAPWDENPFGYSACPSCGSRELATTGGSIGGCVFASTECPACGYKESGDVG